MKKLLFIFIGLFLLNVYGQKPQAQLVFKPVTKSAEFQGGMKGLMSFIKENTIYPKEAVKNDIVGMAIVKFVINENGKTSDAKIKQTSGNELLDAEALRLVSVMPAWNPAMMDSIKVKTYFTLPVNSNINGALSEQKKKQHNLSIKIYENAMKDFQNKDYAKAKDKFARTYLLNNTFENALYNLGITYHNLGMQDSACVVWQELTSSFGRKDGEELVKKYCSN